MHMHIHMHMHMHMHMCMHMCMHMHMSCACACVCCALHEARPPPAHDTRALKGSRGSYGKGSRGSRRAPAGVSKNRNRILRSIHFTSDEPFYTKTPHVRALCTLNNTPHTLATLARARNKGLWSLTRKPHTPTALTRMHVTNHSHFKVQH